ncbi:hypothetical protein F5050DRAFT_1573257 [Lentinula boryana]|uniref:Uncharacterized protein n=1 Tax=Lentinula boryana TaxID=40481 RepID=A0ABQ8QAQ4_9AGAR|nr:hypothetical protein F5050DRAFT_1573257 [Lentinula boryana]
MALCWRCFIQISALSTFAGRIEAYHGFNGEPEKQQPHPRKAAGVQMTWGG